MNVKLTLLTVAALMAAFAFMVGESTERQRGERRKIKSRLADLNYDTRDAYDVQ